MKYLFLLLALALPTQARAEEVRYLKRPDAALWAYLGMIHNAKKSVDLATFIFEPCHASGQAVMNELKAKAKSGVRVRVLLDAFMQSKTQRAQLAQNFRDNGIELRWYNPRLFLGVTYNLRTHAKLLLVDNEAYFSGGRNIADDYFGLHPSENFLDTDLAVKGDSAREAAASFQEIWDADSSEPASELGPRFTRWAQVCSTNEENRVKSIDAFLKKNGKELSAKAPVRQCASVSFHSDNPDFTRPNLTGDMDPRWDTYMTPMRLRHKRTSKAFLDFLSNTRRGVELENWSYMPVNYMEKAFSDLRARRVPVHVISNANMDGGDSIRHAEEFVNGSFAKRDNRGTQTVIQLSMHGGMNDSYALTPRGAKFRIHSKVAVRDGTDVLVGSFNIDPRSYSTNLETAVQVDGCPALAKDAQVEFDRLRSTYVADVKSGKIPAPERPSFLGIVLALIGTNFL